MGLVTSRHKTHTPFNHNDPQYNISYPSNTHTNQNHTNAIPVVNHRATLGVSNVVRADTGVDIITHSYTANTDLLHEHKGLYNSIGLHHCFLNVCIQSLWHLHSFRQQFLQQTTHQHIVEPCIYCALKTIFIQYQSSNQLIIPPDVLRTALAQLYTTPKIHIHRQSTADIHIPTQINIIPVSPNNSSTDDIIDLTISSSDNKSNDSKPVDDIDEFIRTTTPNTHTSTTQSSTDSSVSSSDSSLEYTDIRVSTRFAINEQADASEAFETILKWLHCDHLGMSNIDADDIDRLIDSACEPPCISHSIFGEMIVDIKKCTKCGATSDPDTSTSFLYRVYVNELLDIKLTHESYNMTRCFKYMYYNQTYSCPRNSDTNTLVCTGETRVMRYCLSVPKVFVLMLAWATDEVERPQLTNVMNTIQMNIDLSDFMSMPHNTTTHNKYQYQLSGILFYYGRHYVCIFYSTVYAAWLMFDDRKVSKVGQWNNVIDKCVLGKLQPVTIFYQQYTADSNPHNNTTNLSIPSATKQSRSPSTSPVRAQSVSPQQQASYNANSRRR